MPQLFRTTTYEIPAGSFNSTSYNLVLNQDLEEDYFVEIQGVGNADVRQSLCDSLCRVSADPFGTGDLALSGATDEIVLTRGAVEATPDGDWVGTIVVHECLDGTSADGFTLADVRVTSLAAQTDGSVTDTTQAISNVSTASQVVPFTGRGGGGISTAATANTHSTHTMGIKVEVDSSSQITLSRETNYGYDADAADVTSFIVEFGSNWTVQTADFSTTTGGADVDDTADYATASLTSAPAANTKLFFTGHDSASTQGATRTNQGVTVVMGDGVTVSDDSVAVGRATGGTTLTARVYAMTHSSLDVDWVFQSNSTPSGVSTTALTIPSAANTETYGVNNTVGRSVTIRAASASSEVSHNLREQVFGRITADTTLTWRGGFEPPYGSDGLAFWASVEDYAGFTTGSEDITLAGDVTGTSTVAGSLTLNQALAGSATGTAAVTGNLTVPTHHSLEGAISAVATVRGAFLVPSTIRPVYTALTATAPSYSSDAEASTPLYAESSTTTPQYAQSANATTVNYANATATTPTYERP